MEKLGESEAPKTATTFTPVDARSEHQKTSYKETDANGTNSSFGDDKLNPSGPASLKSTLQRKLGPELSGISIILTDFSVSVYEPSVSLPYGEAAPLTELIVLRIKRL